MTLPNRTSQLKPIKLRFNSILEILSYTEKLTQAIRIESLGNWTAGQTLEHLAKSFNSSIRESQARLPFVKRTVARFLKPYFLRFGLPSGVQISRISKVAASEFLPRQIVPLNEGKIAFVRAINSILTTKMSAKHNCFGQMTHQDWERMHCRHAELHLRLLIPFFDSQTQSNTRCTIRDVPIC